MAQIADKLDLSQSTVRYHLKRLEIPSRSISAAITGLNLLKGKKPFVLKGNLSAWERQLKVAGTMLYWGEGAKTGGTVKFTNSDHEMIRIFLVFLRHVCGIHEPRLKAIVHAYEDQDRVQLEKFWSATTGIPRGRFYTTYVHVGRPGSYKKKSIYGTLALNYSDKLLLDTILGWIKDYTEGLNRQRLPE
jgi:hypothetical protein